MVKSGLAVRTSVSQYRLTAHLTLAILVYAYTVWLAADLKMPAPRRISKEVSRGFYNAAKLILGLVFLTIIAGGFTAGLKAGFTYNTFPLMEWKAGAERLSPAISWYRNLFENIATVQFDHRCLAIITLIGVVSLWAAARRRALPQVVAVPLNLMLAAALLQVGLGISTLLLIVPVPLAAAHQACAVLLLTATLLTVHSLRRISV